MEKKLLDLTLEYQSATEWGTGPLGAERTPDEIATEYGQVLKQFLAS